MTVYDSIPPELSVPTVTVDGGVRTLANETKLVAPNIKGIIITHFNFLPHYQRKRWMLQK